MADEPAQPAGGAQQGPEGGSEPTESTRKPSGSGGEKTFTQAEVDELLQKRLARQKAQFGDVDELRQKAQRLEELENQQRSDSEKLQAAAEKAQKEAQEAAERERQAIERANGTLKRAAVVSAAARLNAVDPDDVYRLLDQDKLTLDDDGKVQGVEDAVKALLEAKPHLVTNGQRQQPSGFDGGPRATAPTAGGTDQMNSLIRQRAGFGSS